MATSTDITLTSATTGVLAHMAPLLESAFAYAEDARATNTRRAYATDWRAFEAWCADKGVSSLPATPATVAVYLAALADSGRKVGGIERALAGVVYYQRAAGHDWPKGAKAVRDVLSGIRRRLGVAPSKKTPVLDGDLLAMATALPDSLIGIRDRALVTLGWVGAFRRSELASLRFEDVRFERDGLVVTLRRSKTDQEGEGYAKGIPYASNPALCPVRALKDWLDAAGITTGPVFRSVAKNGKVGESLSDKAVARIVKKLAEGAGLDPDAFGGHSLRAGFATSAAKKGKSLDAIMRQTGHKSERVARGYIRHATLFTDNAAVGVI